MEKVDQPVRSMGTDGLKAREYPLQRAAADHLDARLITPRDDELVIVCKEDHAGEVVRFVNAAIDAGVGEILSAGLNADHPRWEERRVGKVCRYRWEPYH